MNFDEYQQEAHRTYGDHGIPYLALGLAGEAAEVGEIVKKWIYHGHPLDPEALKKEIGDVQWHLAVLCAVLGWDLDKIAVANIAKLEARYPDGFSKERSRERRDRDANQDRMGRGDV